MVDELGGNLSERAVLKRLRKLKMVRAGSSKQRRPRGGMSSRMPVEQLRELYEQFKDKVS